MLALLVTFLIVSTKNNVKVCIIFLSDAKLYLYPLLVSRIVETPQLLVANGKKLMSLHPDGSGSIQGKDVDLSVGLLSNMYALDYVDINGRQSVVYTDQGAVKRRSLDGSDEAIITNGIPGLRGIAVDCTTGNIYYSDIQKGTITVSNFEGTAQRVCYASISRPFTIALNTKKG